MTGKEIAPFPKKDKRDTGYRVARAISSAVPFVGGALQEILDVAIGLPSEKRSIEWFKTIAEALQELCDQVEGLSPESLGQNKAFQSVVAKATEVAMRYHQFEKLEALRNIVINTASGFSVDEILQNTFLDLVDRYSALHIRILKLHNGPDSFPNFVENVGNFHVLLTEGIPICGEEFWNEVEIDLIAANLIHGGPKKFATRAGLVIPRTTDRGRTFVDFISKGAVGG